MINHEHHPQHAPELWWAKPHDPSMSLRSQIHTIRDQHADRRAVLVAPDQWLTHGDLHRRALRLTQAINAARKANPGPIACLVGTNASLYVCLICVINANADFSMLDPASPPKRNQLAAQSIDAQIVLVDHTTVHLAAALVGNTGIIINIDTDESEQVDTEFNTDDAYQEGRAFIFTSGSTGQPKGVIRSFASMLHSQYNISARLSYEPTDTLLYMGSPGHVGTINDALSVLLNGHASVALSLENLDISAVWKAIIKYQITKASLAPSLMRVCLRYGAEHEKATSMKCVAASGEPLLRSDIALFYSLFDESVQLWQSYGSTECGHMCAGYYSPQDAIGIGPLPLNKPASDVHIEIIDENENPILPGSEGDIRVRTPGLAEGYTTAYQSSKNGFGCDEDGRYFITGDRAQLLDDHKIVIIGRADRQVNIHGRRLELSEVESAILSIKGTIDASVVLLERTDQSHQIAAMVSTSGEGDVRMLRRELGLLLPQSAVPRLIQVVDQLPKTITGKTDVQAVTQALQSVHLQSCTHTAPQDDPPIGPTENWIADAWQEVMRTKRRPDRNIGFDEYGGDSLNAINLCLTLGQQFGIEVGINFITDHPTIAMQAQFLLQSDQIVKHNRFVCLQNTDTGPVLFLFPGLGGHAWVYRAFARELGQQTCTLIAINYLTSTNANNPALHPKHLAQEITAHLSSNQLQNRELFFAGYSMGSLVASGVANAIEQTEAPPTIQALFLLDPSPLASPTPLRRGINFAKKVVRRFRSTKPEHVLEQAAHRHLDMEVQCTSKALYQYYHPNTTSIANHRPCRALFTRQGYAKMPSNHTIFGHHLQNNDLTVLEGLNHLDLLRDKGVARCAQWVWEHIESYTVAPPPYSLPLSTPLPSTVKAARS